MDGNPELGAHVVENDLVQLAPVPVEVWCLLRVWRRLLVDNNLARVELVDVEAVGAQVDAQLAHPCRDLSIVPAVEDAARVGAERNNIAQDLELREGLVDLDVDALAVQLDGRAEAAEAWSW